ncbi:MAG: hypothetical protein FVQ82_02465 [Planctomycetes bacterium]|nr:hypothetical protein [Planctomycetota bacterium]
MRAITIEEILGHIECFENSLTDFFDKIHDETHDEGARLLTDYIARHRHRTLAALDECPHEVIDRIKKLPLQYQPDIPGEHCFKEIKLSPDATPLVILEAAIAFDECMVQMYRQISRQPVAHEIKDLFENLSIYEEADEIDLKKIRQMFSR